MENSELQSYLQGTNLLNYLAGAINTALLERDGWSVIFEQRDSSRGTHSEHRCTICIPGRGVFVSPNWCWVGPPRDEQRDAVAKERAYGEAVAQVAESYCKAMLNQIATDERRQAEDRMPDRRMMG